MLSLGYHMSTSVSLYPQCFAFFAQTGMQKLIICCPIFCRFISLSPPLPFTFYCFNSHGCNNTTGATDCVQVQSSFYFYFEVCTSVSIRASSNHIQITPFELETSSSKNKNMQFAWFGITSTCTRRINLSQTSPAFCIRQLIQMLQIHSFNNEVV